MNEAQQKLDPEPVKAVSVRYYTCNCEWISKYCDEFHTARALVPVAVLEKYTKEGK